MSVQWNEWKWPEAKAQIADRPFALLPIGAVEEHGPHLPLGTDSYTADHLAAMLAENLPVTILPTMPYGQVWSLSEFPGSLTMSDDTLRAFLGDLGRSLRTNAVAGLVILSGHLGNVKAMQLAARDLWDGERFPVLPLCFPGLDGVFDAVSDTPRWNASVMHADEIETSLVLAARPDLVDMDAAVRDYPDTPEHFGASTMRWDEISTTGVFGDATAASAAKGTEAFEMFAASATTVIKEWCQWAQQQAAN